MLSEDKQTTLRKRKTIVGFLATHNLIPTVVIVVIAV